MSKKLLSAGKSASVSSCPQQTDADLMDARGARTGESASVQGAPPSNTAPYNGNVLTSGGFRLLRRAVDSIYLSYPGELHASVFAALQKLKALAQSDHPEEQVTAQYPIGNHVFEVKDKGARLFPFVLEDNAYRIQLSRPGKRLPMAYVKVSAEYLAYRGPRAVHEELLALLPELGDLTGTNMVSRIDLAADFGACVVMDSWHRSAWVTRAEAINNYAKALIFTGWAIGAGGAISCRLYNKTEEIVVSGKAWAVNLWLPGGWRPGEDVWRLEFQFKRDFLNERGLSSIESVLDNLNGLWSYATTEWLRLTVPNDTDSKRSRWPTHDLWVALASVDWEGPEATPLEKCSNARSPSELRLITLVLGALTSFMAMHGIDDRNEGIDQLVGKLYEHFSTVAAKDGLSFDEFLAQRLALKARTFNTAVASPGLVENLKQDYLDERIDAYRRASRGE